MKSSIVLAMHGAPPNDFPRREMAEMFSLRSRLGHSSDSAGGEAESRYAELEARMRAWPRTAQNDPYHAASYELASQLSRLTECPVVVGFNEFCSPSLDEALNQAAVQADRRVVIITPMMTRGGEHSEVDIPAAVERARQRYPEIDFHYQWPFHVSEIARFLASQIRHVL